MTWEDEEIAIRADYTQSRVRASIVTETIFIAYSAFTAGICSVQVAGFCIALVLTVVPVRMIPRMTLRGQKWCVFTYFEATQSMVMLAAVYIQPGVSSLFCVVTTLVLAITEVTPVYAMWLNILLVVKHMALWTYILSSNYNFSFFPFGILPVAWSIYHVILCVSKRREVLEVLKVQIQSLHTQEQQLESLLQAIPDGVAVLTRRQEILTCNYSFQQQFAVAEWPAILAGLQYAENYRQDRERDMLVKDLSGMAESRVGEIHCFPPVLHDDCYLECRGVMTMWKSDKVCILTVRDTSKWVDLERKAQTENERKTAMLRSVSHELRTPTNAILNLTLDLQANEQLSPQGQTDSTLVVCATSFLLSLINDLLDFSRIIHDKFSLQVKRFSLQKTLEYCLKLLEPQCRCKNIELRWRFDPLLPDASYSDDNRVRQVVLNLLSNALKFTLQGSITLVATMVSDTHVRVSVEDTGIGISAADQARIFQLFGKLEDNQKLNSQGCGLGLGISTVLVEKLGGSGIIVASQVGKGSVFSFTIPVVYTSEDSTEITSLTETEEWEIACESVPHSLRASTDCSGSYHPPQSLPDVLVVDDSSFNRIVARKLVEARRYTCCEASTGRQAVDAIVSYRDKGHYFSAVLMDMEMPEMNGAEATAAIREMESSGALERITVIIGCSANASAEDKFKALESGMDHYIEKPINREELYNLLERYVA